MATPFGEWIHKNRRARSLSLQQLADRMGVSKDITFRLEKGSPATPPAKIVTLVAEILGRPLVEALEALGYEMPSLAVDSRLDPSLVEILGKLPLQSQAELANALPFLIGLAQKMVYGEPGEELLHAAEGSGEYKAPHPKGPLAGSRAKRGLKES